MSTSSKNDNTISCLSSDQHYAILTTGDILTKIGKNGKPGATWRLIGFKDRSGYMRIWYRGIRLFVHRIVYQKYVGDLQTDKVVHHKDSNPVNNSYNNLQLTDQKTNIYYRDKRMGVKCSEITL